MGTLHCTFISISPTWYCPLGQDRLKSDCCELENTNTYFISNAKRIRVNLVFHQRVMFYI